MLFFYVDESGDPAPHHAPLLEGETPLFCLSAVSIDSRWWRDFDRSLIALKRTYFTNEMVAFTTKHPDRRAEYYEVKGRDLFKPSNARSRRNRVFATKVFELAESLGARLFGVACVKSHTNPVDPVAIYTHALQILAERFHYHCLAASSEGIIVADSRTHNLNYSVASSHLSFLFGNPTGRKYTSLIEGPMFVDSSLSAGMQLADILGGAVFGYYYSVECSKIPGIFKANNQPVTVTEFTQDPIGPPWTARTPARDYSHCGAWWPKLDSLQFKRSDVPPPKPGALVPGYFGFRVLRHA